MDNRVAQLEEMIRQSIIIPNSLLNNCRITTTGLGGVFIEFYSNTSDRLACENSKYQFRLMFDTTDGGGRFEGLDIGLEVTRAWNIKMMRGIKKKKPWQEVVKKVNDWLSKNEVSLYGLIENK